MIDRQHVGAVQRALQDEDSMRFLKACADRESRMLPTRLRDADGFSHSSVRNHAMALEIADLVRVKSTVNGSVLDIRLTQAGWDAMGMQPPMGMEP